MNNGTWESFLDWVNDRNGVIIGIVIIIIVAWILTRFASMIITRSVRRMLKSHRYVNKEEEEKREQTVINILNGTFVVIVWSMATLIILSKLGINVAPLIAGAGIAGVALGFGAQSLVKDTISGMFIIGENQYRIGDVVKLSETAGETSGMVESITLRKTVLRDLDGVAHHVPNGEIIVASNMSSEQSGVNLDIGVSYSSDLEKIIDVINGVGESIASDEKWADIIIEQPSFLRVDNFGESSIILKITGTVAPLRQWDVTGELRKRIKIAFDKNDIEIPFPQRVIHYPKTAKETKK